MKLLENYSLQLGQKIGKCHTYEKFYPLSFDKFIVIQPWSKPSKNYGLWSQVISIIFPVIDKAGYKLVQVGAANEPPVNGCLHTQGSTNWGQLEYLISKAELVISTDSISSHLAGHYNKPLVCLINNNFKECVAPFFGDKNKQIILEPKRNGNPSFSNEERVKSINTINPEDIAFAICKLLNLELNYPYKSLFMGDIFIAPMIESAMTDPINVSGLGVTSLITRMDFTFNEQVLEQQLSVCPCSIVTNKPINLNLLKKFKGERLKEIVYFVEKDNHDFDFYKGVIRLGTSLRFISRLPAAEIQDLKIKYFEIGVVQGASSQKLTDIKSDLTNLHYISAKFTLSNGKIYPSRAAMLEDKAISNIIHMPPEPVINNEVFEQELQHFRVLEKSA